jgi:hypothetical protein
MPRFSWKNGKMDGKWLGICGKNMKKWLKDA